MSLGCHPEWTKLRYWESGLHIARAWFHEEWNGSYIQLTLARDIAKVIEREVEAYIDGILK